MESNNRFSYPWTKKICIQGNQEKQQCKKKKDAEQVKFPSNWKRS